MAEPETAATASPTGKKMRWLAGNMAVVAGVALITVLMFRFVPFLKTSVQWMTDFETATLQPREPQHPDILVVAITEETLEKFPYRSPVDRAFLARTLKALDERGVRGILVDLLMDQGTEPEKDAQLKETLHTLRAPIVVSYGLTDGGLTERQIAYENAFLKPEIRGLANIIKDTAGGTVRSIYPGRVLADGQFMTGVVGALVTKLGGQAPAQPVPLAFRGPPDAKAQAFRILPAQAVPILPRAWFAGKIVLIGTTISLADRHRTPYAVVRDDDLGNMPGVVIHAHAVAQLLEGRRAAEPSVPDNVALCLVFAVLGLILGRSRFALGWRIAAALTVILGWWLGAMALITAGGPVLPLVEPVAALILASWATDILVHRQEREQRRFLQLAFAKYVSPAVLEEIIHDPSKMTLRAVRKEISVIFTDVAGFTTLSETLDAEQLSDILNRYRSVLARTLFEYGGTLNQFTGDGLYAMFNAPRDQPDHAVRALACAMALDRAAMAFHHQEVARGIPFGITRIGVHCAEAAVGNFGSDERFEYIALGDTINTAARVEGLNKYFSTHICVTGPTARANPDASFRPIGQIVMKGKTEPVEILEPLHPEAVSLPLVADYRQAYALLETESATAAAAFRSLAEKYPGDGIIAFHLNRLQSGATGTRVVMAEK